MPEPSPLENSRFEQMRLFYEMFPYPSRPLFFTPKREFHLLSHGGFSALLQKNNLECAQYIWNSIKKNKTISFQSKNKLKQIYFQLAEEFPENKRILLLGCGTDEPLLFRILHPYHEIVAIDLGRKNLIKAKRKLQFFKMYFKILKMENWRKTEFIIGHSEAILGSSHIGKFDYIQCFGFIHHQDNPRESMKVISKSLNENGILRMMVYSFHGRKLERKIQKRYKKMWDNLIAQKTSKWNLMIHYYFLIIWQFLNYLGLKKSTKSRFRYLGSGRRTVADALMHPSDNGLCLSDLYDFAKENQLKLIFCEAILEKKGLVADFHDPEKIWREIIECDKRGELLSNPIVFFRKEHLCTKSFF